MMRPPVARRIGFTLLELLLALGILVIAAGVLVPTVMSVYSQRDLKSQAERVRKVILETRANAIRLGLQHEIEFDSGSGQWAIYAKESDWESSSVRDAGGIVDVDELNRGIVGSGELGTGIRFVSPEEQSGGGSLLDGGISRIVFPPGTSIRQPAVEIVLEDRDTHQRIIRYRPLTGEVTIRREGEP